jgi:hypothetical protein
LERQERFHRQEDTMGIIGELKDLYDLVDKVQEKWHASNDEKMRDKVVIAIYKLGNNGNRAVDARQLEQEGGFSKIKISKAIKMANEQGWIHDMSSHDGMAWALKPKAVYYVKGLIGE